MKNFEDFKKEFQTVLASVTDAAQREQLAEQCAELLLAEQEQFLRDVLDPLDVASCVVGAFNKIGGFGELVDKLGSFQGAKFDVDYEYLGDYSWQEHIAVEDPGTIEYSADTLENFCAELKETLIERASQLAKFKIFNRKNLLPRR